MTRYGVTDGQGVHLVVDTHAEALLAAQRAVKADGIRRWTVRIDTVKRVTSQTPAPPEPLVEDD